MADLSPVDLTDQPKHLLRTLVDLLDRRVGKTPKLPCVATRYDSGRDSTWIKQNWLEFGVSTLGYACSLDTLGFKKGERMATYARATGPLVAAELGALRRGIIVHPLMDAMAPAVAAERIRSAGCKALIVDPECWRKIESYLPTLPELKYVFLDRNPTDHSELKFPESVKGTDLFALDTQGLSDSRISHARSNPLVFSSCARMLNVPMKSEETAFVYQTSGTGADIKPVVVTNAMMLGTTRQIRLRFGDEFSAADRLMSLLTYGHVMGLDELLITILWGLECNFLNDKPARVREHLQAIAPTVIFFVPDLFTKMRQKLLLRLQEPPKNRKDRIQKKLARLAFSIHESESRWAAPLRFLLAPLFIPVFKKIREAFGGKLHTIVAGGAPFPKQVGFFLKAFIKRVILGYGLTETIGVVTATDGSRAQLGSIGSLLSETEATLLEVPDRPGQKQLALKGPSIMPHYGISAAQPDSMIQSPFQDGWFKTGDLGAGRWVKGRFLHYVVGRAKAGFKIGADFVSPEKIELLFAAEPLISQAVVMGEGKNRPGAVFYLDPDALAESLNRIGHTTTGPLNDDPVVRKLVQEIILRINSSPTLADFEKPNPNAFCILDTPLSVENGLLTGTNKPKRYEIEPFYMPQIPWPKDGG